MKICVYAICKNERKFLDKWIEAVSEADCVCVLDTGSTDGTWKELQRRQDGRKLIAEQKIITPWRFDTARNESMKLIPTDTDVCLCLDLDELPSSGWRKAIEASWNGNCGRYDYIWNFLPDGRPGHRFSGEKCHSYGAIRWKSPVHEYPQFLVPRVDCALPFTVEHHADDTKSRSSYLPLLELAVQEDPLNDRNRHYLGREYMFYGKWQQAIETLKHHLAMPSAVWRPERSNSMRFIGRCEKALKNTDAAELWYFRAHMEAPERREPLMDLAQLYYKQMRWRECRWACEAALSVTERSGDYLTEPEAWGALPYDLLSIAAWKLGDTDGALLAAKNALSMEPENERIQNNVKIMEGELKTCTF